jgi:hypothetical protein
MSSLHALRGSKELFSMALMSSSLWLSSQDASTALLGSVALLVAISSISSNVVAFSHNTPLIARPFAMDNSPILCNACSSIATSFATTDVDQIHPWFDSETLR